MKTTRWGYVYDGAERTLHGGYDDLLAFLEFITHAFIIKMSANNCVNKFRRSNTSLSETKDEPEIPLRNSQKITTNKNLHPGDKGQTSLINSESICKSDKLLAALGSIEELSAYIGIIKACHFSGTESKGLFHCAHLTQVQECLQNITLSLGTSKKVNARFENSRFASAEKHIGDLEREIERLASEMGLNLSTKPIVVSPGHSPLEAQLLYSRAICRRAERQVCSCKNPSLGIVVEESVQKYLNRLGDYLLYLALKK
jgi:cob(I)alamin adenosyltransferase